MVSFRLPDFFAVGPPRTGTTWLHHALAGRANLPRHNKETRFFDTHYSKGLDWYARHFERPSDLPTAEVCPTYFSSELARDRIARLIPAARIICSFRDPVERIFSLYKVKRAYGFTCPEFEAALTRDPELMESSRYAFHLLRWQRAFGAGNVLATFYEDLVAESQSYVDRIAQFTGIPKFRLDETRLRRVNSSDDIGAPRIPGVSRLGTAVADWLKAHHRGQAVAAVKASRLARIILWRDTPIPHLASATACRLRRELRPEVEALEEMLNRDLSAWKQE